jgi:phosphoglycolate phosphatase-like HAD superfamily hydrolase
MSVKVLLFDVDGTLVRAGGAGGRALDRAVERRHGVARVCANLNFQGKTDLRNFSEAIVEAIGRRPSRGELDAVHREYLRELPRQVRVSLRGKKYEVTRGIRALLERLAREENVLLGLGTGNMRRGADIKLEPSGLGRFFSFGGFGCDSYHRPDLLRRGVARARRLRGGKRIFRKDVWVIGDTPLDVSAGKRAGYRTIAVGTGWSRWEDLVAAKPDYLARDFRNPAKWLKWIGI